MRLCNFFKRKGIVRTAEIEEQLYTVALCEFRCGKHIVGFYVAAYEKCVGIARKSVVDLYRSKRRICAGIYYHPVAPRIFADRHAKSRLRRLVYTHKARIDVFRRKLLFKLRGIRVVSEFCA